MSFEKLTIEVKNEIATITLNSPDNLNALDPQMIEELIEVLDKCAGDNEIRAVILTAKGNAFCSGGDINALKNALEEAPEKSFGVIRKLGFTALRIRNLKKPVIAAINGAAAGAGFNLALACDFRICTEETKFVQAFVNIGLVSDMGGVHFLTQMLGAAKATELLMTGRTVSSKEAKEIGLVNQVVASDELEKASKELAATLASGPTKSLGKLKTLINRSAFSGLEESLNNELEYQIEAAKTEDFKEGVTAFLEKRKPEFKGE